jgi:hypothetical protein
VAKARSGSSGATVNRRACRIEMADRSTFRAKTDRKGWSVSLSR